MDSNTPSPSASSVSPASRSPLSESVSTVAGAGVCIFALTKVAPLLACQCDDKRWMWGLGAAVLIAVPTSARQLLDLGRTVLKR